MPEITVPVELMMDPREKSGSMAMTFQSMTFTDNETGEQVGDASIEMMGRSIVLSFKDEDGLWLYGVPVNDIWQAAHKKYKEWKLRQREEPNAPVSRRKKRSNATETTA